MKINTHEDSFELGFPVPEPGTYLFQIQEGVELFTNENTGKTSLKVPTRIIEMVDGDEGSIDMPVTHFIPIETARGERQACSLLTITGLSPAFEKKFPDDTSFMDQRFIDALKIKLPGKFFKGEIDVRENRKGQKFASLQRWQAAGKGKGSTIPDGLSNSKGPVNEDW